MSGCASVGAAGGAVAGAATGLLTANPAIGIGVGIAVQAATDEAVRSVMRSVHIDQQNAIASLVGSMRVGEIRRWRGKTYLPIENGHGRVRVMRSFRSALADCKEFAFSVQEGQEDGASERWFIATTCQQNSGWKWALAEPSVSRWGNLQ
jgi:hypothetical protein